MMIKAKKRVNDAEENDNVYMPKWMYLIIGTVSVAALGAFIGFCSWLSLTAIEHGKHLEIHSTELRHINKSLSSIDDKIAQLSNNNRRINELQNELDSMRNILNVAPSKTQRGEDGYYY